MTAYMRVPPPGHSRVSLQQLQAADRELFLQMACQCRAGIKMKPDASYPLENALRSAMDSPDVRYHLQPLAASSSSRSTTEHNQRKRKADDHEDDRDERNKRRIQHLENRIKNLTQGTSNHEKKHERYASMKGGGKGKFSKGKGDRQVKMPKELIGMHYQNHDGEPLCFNYNLDGCSNAEAGKKCDKGWHLCARRGCLRAHSQRKH